PEKCEDLMRELFPEVEEREDLNDKQQMELCTYCGESRQAEWEFYYGNAVKEQGKC
ncbi:unnamed protein product, partial [marine sediment metagenome]